MSHFIKEAKNWAWHLSGVQVIEVFEKHFEGKLNTELVSFLNEVCQWGDYEETHQRELINQSNRGEDSEYQ